MLYEMQRGVGATENTQRKPKIKKAENLVKPADRPYDDWEITDEVIGEPQDFDTNKRIEH